MDESSTTSVAGSEAVPSGETRENVRAEIDLADYLCVLWKYKYLVFLGCVVPTLIVGSFLFFKPDSYSTTYKYSELDYHEESFEVFLSRFYSRPNVKKLSKIISGGNAPGRMANGDVDWPPSDTVRFDVWPPFPQSAKLRAANTEEAKRLLSPRADLLQMTVMCDSKDELIEMASILRNNVENVMALMDAEKGLRESIVAHKTTLANTEAGRFPLELSLNTNKAVLARLKKMTPASVGDSASETVLQFNIGGRSEYLPLAYRVQAIETEIVKLEERIQQDEKTYKYYQNLISLDERILNEIVSKMADGYTIQDFHSFLTNIESTTEEPELTDYLSSYIKKIENDMLLRIPVSQVPQIRQIETSICRETALVFAVALVVSAFSAFLLEGIRRARKRL